MSETNRPTIQFPCEDYPIRVIGETDAEFAASVVSIVRGHDDYFREETVSLKASSQGTYTSVRFSIRATGEAQLKALHAELMSHPLVRLVL